MNNRFIYLLILIGTFIPVQLFAQQNSGTYVETPRSVPSQNDRRRLEPIKTRQDTTKHIYKELVQELPAEKNALIKIVNTTCNLDIRPWPEAKVKLVTTVGISEKEAAKATPEQLMEEAGIVFKSFGNRVDIQTRTTFAGSDATGGSLFRSVGQSGKYYVSMKGNVDVTESTYPNNAAQPVRWMTSGSTLRNMVLYVPDGCRLDVNNKNTGIVINADIEEARFELSRSSLDARNFKKLFVTAEYYSINISDVQEAELELESGNFTGGVIRSLDLDSKGSEIDYESGEILYVRSQNDRLYLDEIAKVDGRKHFGDFRIGKLTGGLDLEGTNTDVRIRNITSTVEKIKINDRFGNLRLPVKNITNYEVEFKGTNTTVFAPFEKTIIPDTIAIDELKNAYLGNNAQKRKTTSSFVPDTVINRQQLVSVVTSTGVKKLMPVSVVTVDGVVQGSPGELAPSRFKASVGTPGSKLTKFEVTCNNCTVDFK